MCRADEARHAVAAARSSRSSSTGRVRSRQHRQARLRGRRRARVGRTTTAWRRAGRGTPRKQGHIPGALSIPFTSITDDDAASCKPPTSWRRSSARPASSRATRSSATATSASRRRRCCSRARTLGYPVLLYDGSFEDWARRGLPGRNRRPASEHCRREPAPVRRSVSGAASGSGSCCSAAFVVMGRGLGASGAFASAAPASRRRSIPAARAANAYFAELPGGRRRPWHDWLVFEIVGVVIGGFVSAWLAGRLRVAIERGPRCRARTRLVAAFGGGAVMGVGAVLARGCTSGQALTGGALLSVGSWLFMIGGVRRRRTPSRRSCAEAWHDGAISRRRASVLLRSRRAGDRHRLRRLRSSAPASAARASSPASSTSPTSPCSR